LAFTAKPPQALVSGGIFLGPSLRSTTLYPGDRDLVAEAFLRRVSFLFKSSLLSGLTCLQFLEEDEYDDA